MYALIVYVVCVVVFGFASYEVAKVAEQYMSNAASLGLFLMLFFANFVIAWWVTYLIMERSEKRKSPQPSTTS